MVKKKNKLEKVFTMEDFDNVRIGTQIAIIAAIIGIALTFILAKVPYIDGNGAYNTLGYYVVFAGVIICLLIVIFAICYVNSYGKENNSGGRI